MTGRDDGSGLGLTLAQAFISQHHGTIELESRPGYTSFSVLLPIANDHGRTAVRNNLAARGKMLAQANKHS